MKRLLTLALLPLLTIGTAQATLIDRGGGLIYDDVLNITWLQDANHGAGTTYDNGSSATDGRMTWDNAVAWSANLSYGGYDDWRLPTMTDTGTPGCDFSYNGTDCGYNVQTTAGATVYSEMASMWDDTLGNTPTYDTNGNPQAGGLTSTSADGVTIDNLISYTYWSGLEYAPDTSYAWGFRTVNGDQGYGGKDNQFHAWAVRSGDSLSAVPIPAAVWLFGTGLIGLIGLGRCRRRDG
ncbi:MAG: DUF1566 domain-containing protein [Sedimenticola sp.]